MKFKNHYNAEPSEGEKLFGPSQTVPDQSMSVTEIMRRYASGLPMQGERVPIYDGDEELIPNWDKMDLADRQQLKAHLEQELYEVNQRLKKQDKPKETAEKPQNEHIEEAVIVEEELPPPPPKNKKNTP